MDFESAFLGNEENFQDAFANNANISNFISKIKNFIFYSDVETAMKLGNKNLAGVLWLGRLLKRRNTNAKAAYLSPPDDNKTSISPSIEMIDAYKEKHSDKWKKANKQTPPPTMAINASSDETRGQTHPYPPPAYEDTILMDLDLIDLKAPHTDDVQISSAYKICVNPYIQDLKSLSEDTFMMNSSSNSAHD
ncbi:hypothetical protein RCL_jg17474.t1 [Rhizophagus clarus]|uniref:Uncharacterized protein n=1 Tax=Rhizophagus clarus TaxID=94130 RepID=A0A8H3KYR1_9GLOM|nr:hypothetical protein RCL_jg17474.t1 [Rhizophagus clarus]